MYASSTFAQWPRSAKLTGVWEILPISSATWSRESAIESSFFWSSSCFSSSSTRSSSACSISLESSAKSGASRPAYMASAFIFATFSRRSSISLGSGGLFVAGGGSDWCGRRSDRGQKPSPSFPSYTRGGTNLECLGEASPEDRQWRVRAD